MSSFRAFQKIPRLNREIVITEKIDGTNASIWIGDPAQLPDYDLDRVVAGAGEFVMLAGSRTRWIVPGDDNFGFAAWAKENAADLFDLGPGHHHGEWWGRGIQRNYGRQDRVFSLFNVSAWAPRGVPLANEKQRHAPLCCSVVPVLYVGPFSTPETGRALWWLGEYGSKAAPGFMQPEGIIVYHTAGGHYYKATLEKDDQPKGKE